MLPLPQSRALRALIRSLEAILEGIRPNVARRARQELNEVKRLVSLMDTGPGAPHGSQEVRAGQPPDDGAAGPVP